MQIRALDAALKRATLVGLFLAAAASGCGVAASFDCDKAKTEVEQAICADPGLSKSDEEMAEAYRAALKRAQDWEGLRREQGAWLRARDEGCGAAVACLDGLYADRVARLLTYPHADDPSERSPDVPERYGPFVILLGARSELCEQYRRILYAVDAQVFARPRNPDAEALFRARHIPEHFSEFSQPVWREIDPREHLDLAVEVARRMESVRNWPDPYAGVSTEQRMRSARSSEGEVLINYRHRHDKWYLSEADVDNDGQPDRLIKFRRGRSPESSRFAVPIMALDDSGNTVDVAKTRQLLLLTPASTYVPSDSFDVFLYESKSYVDRWEPYSDYYKTATAQNHDNTASVYLHVGRTTTMVCRVWRAVRPVGQ